MLQLQKKGSFILLFILSILLAGPASAFTMQDLMNVHPRYINTKTGRIEYFVLGEGKPIVLISGYAANVSSWNRKFLLPLATHNQVIIFDNRNISGSYNNSTSYNSKDLANDAYSLISQLHLQKPAVIGISMGGMIAQQLAVSHSDVVDRLVLINTAIAGKQAVKPSAEVQTLMTTPPQGKISRIFTAMRLMVPPLGWIQLFHELKSDRFIPDGPRELGITKKTLLQQQQLVENWITDNETAKQIANLRIPTLILNGEKDAMIPPINSVILSKTIPNAKIKRWPDGGHMMIYQFPESIADTILNFVNQPTIDS